MNYSINRLITEMTLEEFKIKVLPIKNKLFRYANRMLHNQEEAQDVVQDVFLKLWSKKDELGKYRSVEAFSIIITRNLCLDKLKSHKWKETSISRDFNASDMKNPYSIQELSDTIDKVNLIISELPGQQKEIMQLRDIEQMDYDEISEITKLSMNNIRVILSRARKKVRDELIKLNNYEFSRN